MNNITLQVHFSRYLRIPEQINHQDLRFLRTHVKLISNLVQIHRIIDLTVGIKVDDFSVLSYLFGETFQEVILSKFLLQII